MSEQHDGGPAFPVKQPLSSDALGMTLRDYFAAAALSGMELTAEGGMGDGKFFYGPVTIAKRAYDIADAMTKERDIRAK